MSSRPISEFMRMQKLTTAIKQSKYNTLVVSGMMTTLSGYVDDTVFDVTQLRTDVDNNNTDIASLQSTKASKGTPYINEHATYIESGNLKTSSVHIDELNYLTGATSNIQTQLDAITTTSGTLSHALLSGLLNNDHPQYFAQVQTGAPTPQTGMFWYDTDATGSSVSSTVNLITITSGYTVVAADVAILCSGTFTVTLPTAVGITGKNYYIKNIGSGTITVEGDGIETIDEALTVSLIQHETINVVSDNSEWWIL